MPVPVRSPHEHTHEGASQLLFLPRRGGFARSQGHDEVLPLRRLARLEGDRARNAVALVEHAEHRDALRHRGHPGLVEIPLGRVRGRGGFVRFLPSTATSRERA